MCLGGLLYHRQLNTVLYPIDWIRVAESSYQLEELMLAKDVADQAYVQVLEYAWTLGCSGVDMTVDTVSNLMELWTGTRAYRGMNTSLGIEYYRIPEEMRKLFGGEDLWGNMQSGWVQQTYQPTREWLAEFHIKFERIHPFMDGNGRLGRILNAFYYGRMGQRPVIITDRTAYCNAIYDENIAMLARML